MASHATKVNLNKQPTKQNLIALFNKNLTTFETSFKWAIISELSLTLLYKAFDIQMNCSYFAMERRRTFTVNKKIKQIKQKNKIKYKKKTYKQKNNKQADKPKQNRTKIYKRANEEYITHAQWNIVRSFS